jgi:RHS repeat-associated protein
LESGHFGKRNYSGVSSLSLAALTTGGTLANPGNKYDPVYAYTHSVDEDGKETLEWKNGFGQVVQAAGVLNSQSPSQYAVTRNIYDARGNLVKVLPPIPCQEGSNPRTPQDCVDPTTFDYDDENRLIRENLPDAGTTRHFYDRLGQKRGSQNQRQWREKKIVVHVYDPLGRILQTSEVHDQDPSHGTPDAAVAFFREKIATDPSWPVEFQGSRLITKYFYDEMPDPVPYDMMSSVEDFRFYPAEEWHTFENTRTHLCAVVNFHEPIEAFDPTQRVEPISSIAYRYDKFGRITTTYRYNGFISDPGFKLQKTEVDYDLAGRTAETRHFRSAAQPLPERIAKFTYNSRNQLQEVTDGNGASIARYEYFPTNGKVKSVLLGEDDANPITAEYRYHISGALEQISASKKIGATQSPTFRQKLFYDLLPSGQPGLFNGSIAVQEYQLGTLPGRSTAYQYDRLNRLVNAAYSATSGSNSEYDEAYEYLLDGRIAKLQRGTAVGTPNGGRYHYGDGKNQVKWVEPGMEAGDPRDMSGSDAAPAFLYDENGNLNYDDSKIMLVDYDHRGLPLRFSYVKDGIEHQLETRYDHEGSRVSKIEFARGADEEMEFEESVKTEYLVDGDPNQPRDFSLLAEAYTSLRSQLAEVAEDPGVISIIEVLDPSTNEPDLQIFTGWEAIPYAGGLARTELRAVHRGSPEYYALLNRYSENLQLVKATHYTSFGNEIREDFQVEQGTKTIFNLPQGLGRYEEDGTRLYYLENHQGNTMLAATSSSEGFKAAYDYFPYGRQKVEQTLLADKITETFTGKELDDETGFGGLYYFGARYYDPDLGLWISPDPARQFHSPYAYSPNPIVSVDPDGKFAIIPLIVGYGTVMAADMPEVQADLQIAMMDPDPFGMAVGIAAAFVPGVPAGLAKEGVKGVKAGMIGSYNALRALNKNTGSKLEAHHIIEKRFADIMGQKPGEMLSILVDKTTHNKFTKAMADLIPRGEGTAKATKSEVLEKTKQMYQQVEGK